MPYGNEKYQTKRGKIIFFSEKSQKKLLQLLIPLLFVPDIFMPSKFLQK